MKTKKMFFAVMAALVLSTMPCPTLLASEASATDLTINDRPATPQEKAVAKDMKRQGVKLASKGAELVVAAMTDPKKADKIAKEMEEIGNRMERLGDSLESMAEDTTFLYEAKDSDEVFLSDADLNDIHDDLEELEKKGGLIGFLTGLFGGSLGLLGGILGVAVACVALVIVFGVLTMPLWLLAIIIWLIVRKPRRRPAQTPTTPTSNGSTPEAGATAATATKATSNYVQPYPDENTEIWKSGVMYSCVGVGLIILFCAIGATDLWGIGALVVCIGVAKLVIASTTKGKRKDKTAATTETPAAPDATETPAASDNYEK